MGIVIKNALAVLPQGAEDAVRETNIYIEQDRITGIGQAPEGFTQDKVIDGRDKLVIPGLVNCHTHSYMSFMRNVRMICPLWTGCSEPSIPSSSR